ncbi:MAG: phosphoribosylformylglycinamidine synthase subunit PurQ, partial [Candidatus Hodarchaeota archaeon]
RMVSLEDYQALVIPGGFSFGDHIAAGKIIANYLKLKLKNDIKRFIDQNKPILGICNGFQALLKSGFLDVEATLTSNNSGLFIDKWIHLKKDSESFYNKDIETLFVPINHAEGKFVADEPIL